MWAAPALPFTITVDGNYWDWPDLGPPVQWNGDDPNESAINDSYDIDWNRQTYALFGNQAAGLFFMVEMAVDFDDDTYNNWGWGPASKVDIALDTKQGGGTYRGRSGVDYLVTVRLTQDLGSGYYWTHNFGQTYYETLWEWNPNLNQFSNYGKTAAFGQNHVTTGPDHAGYFEFGILHSDVGYPSKFGWWAYVDNQLDPPDDFCPDAGFDEGYTPEPGTMALFLAGMGGLVLLLRRRKS